MLEFFGHFHPVLVHLPIGILLLACLFMWQARKDKHENLQPIINRILFWGMINAIISCISGYMLSQSGEYDSDLVGWHQWMGISVAAVSVLTYYSRRKVALIKWQWIFGTLLLFLVFITGHLGGSLTHGSDYLTQPLAKLMGEDTLVSVMRKPIINIQEARAYADVIEPILQTKCYSCHGANRQKGKLRMDQQAMLMQGGKDGVVIIAGKADQSEIIKRVMLPREDEHHMAPKEKPQLTGMEISLLSWWIDNGADFTKPVKQLQQSAKIKSMLTSLQSGHEEKKSIPDIPSEPVDKADTAAIGRLEKRGAVILSVTQSSNYLSADFISAPNITDKDMDLLKPLKKQLIWLKLANSNITDEGLAAVGQFNNLVKLQLDHTDITDKGMKALQALSHLQSLNLTGTKITLAGLSKLADLKALQSIYLYQTAISGKDWDAMKKLFPRVTIDTGGYKIPALETDTMTVKPPPKIK